MEARKISAADALRRLPLPATAKWPDGVWDAEVMRHGTMSAEIFAPRGRDHQTPHTQDELYLVIGGTAQLIVDNSAPLACAPGDLLFVPAGMNHHFENISGEFTTWVIFYGPPGGGSPVHPDQADSHA